MSYEQSEHMIHTILGHLAVISYDKSGIETGNNFVPKKQFYTNKLTPFYIANRELKGVESFYVDQFKSFIYLNGKTKSYVLFNDNKKNDNRSLNGGKLMMIDGVVNTDAFYFPLSANEIMPKRKYVYGDPEDGDGHNIGMLQISEYDYERNIFVTLRLKDKKEVSIVWLQPQ